MPKIKSISISTAAAVNTNDIFETLASF